jgi:ATP-dependent Zn protease
MADPTASWTSWQPAGDDRASRLLSALAGTVSPWFATVRPRGTRVTTLPFHRTHELVEITIDGGHALYVLEGARCVHWLHGDSTPLHDANDEEGLRLDGTTAEAYIRCFLFFLRGDEGPFTLIEAPQLIAPGAGTNTASGDVAARLALARSTAAPLTFAEREPEGGWVAHTTMRYGDDLFRTTLTLSADGQLLMTEDDHVVSLRGLDAPAYPPLRPALRGAPDDGVPDGEAPADRTADGDTPDAPAACGHDAIDAPDIAASAPGTGESIAAPARLANEAPEPDASDTDDDPALTSTRRLRQMERGVARDRETTELLVTVLLEEAIRDLEPDPLLRHFNAGTRPGQALQWFASVLDASSPIVVIESDIPFVEEFVAGILDRRLRLLDDGRIVRAESISNDDGICTLTVRPGARALYLFSFHAFRALWAAEQTAHELTVQDVAVLVGCTRRADVPEPLRRVTDLVLRLPRVDRRIFPRVFTSLFGSAPAAGWDDPRADWTRYLLPADFHVPRRLGMGPDEALEYLRERARRRLEAVTPDRAPALADLHGMAEARQVCEDLIADIRAAQAGALPWAHVDRGLLLVGRPGTGKTTLARAVARECGVKFIAASATGWQAAGSLDQHIRAIRASFAEARRYAPAILFIDEIDSIGNREHFTGSNAIYATDVVNALLEQMQGLDPAEPVIVLAATNHERNVDPALRRAGRLDQVVQIPLPSVGGLERILQYHLRPFAASGELAADIDTRTLAALASGRTGADVDFFVRGAARRARKAARPITQADLVAEVTRRPRHPASATLGGEARLRRTAVHEAGHALAMLLGPHGGAELTFVSIVPRLDGSLGFAATMPPDDELATRASARYYLELLLAGRAAEAIVFGADAVGLGAGGPSPQSDLAMATRLATDLVCRSGLGDGGHLLWTEAPTAGQLVEVEALLRRAHLAITERIAQQRPLLDAVVALLLDREEVTGAEVRALRDAPPTTAAGAR